MRTWIIQKVWDSGVWTLDVEEADEKPDVEDYEGVMGVVVHRIRKSLTGKQTSPTDNQLKINAQRVRDRASALGIDLTDGLNLERGWLDR